MTEVICAHCGAPIRASRKTIEVDLRPPVLLAWHWPGCLGDELFVRLWLSSDEHVRAECVAEIEARGPGRVRRLDAV